MRFAVLSLTLCVAVQATPVSLLPPFSNVTAKIEVTTGNITASSTVARGLAVQVNVTSHILSNATAKVDGATGNITAPSKVARGLAVQSNVVSDVPVSLPSDSSELGEVKDNLLKRRGSLRAHASSVPEHKKSHKEEGYALIDTLDDIEETTEEPVPAKLKIEKILGTVVHDSETERDELSVTEPIDELSIEINEVADDVTIPAEEKLQMILDEVNVTPSKRDVEEYTHHPTDILDEVIEKVSEILNKTEPAKQKIQDILNEIVSHVRAKSEDPTKGLLMEVESLLKKLEEELDLPRELKKTLLEILYEVQELLEEPFETGEAKKLSERSEDTAKSLIEEVMELLEEIE